MVYLWRAKIFLPSKDHFSLLVGWTKETKSLKHQATLKVHGAITLVGAGGIPPHPEESSPPLLLPPRKSCSFTPILTPCIHSSKVPPPCNLMDFMKYFPSLLYFRTSELLTATPCPPCFSTGQVYHDQENHCRAKAGTHSAASLLILMIKHTQNTGANTWIVWLKAATLWLNKPFFLPPRVSLVAQRLKRLPAMRETRVRSLGREDPLEKEMVTHSSILAWRIPWTEEPGGLQSTGSQRVGHDWATSLHFFLP